MKDIDQILNALKEQLVPAQDQVRDRFDSSQFPLGFIVGNPRSGTTLFLQWLSSLGCFSYPSNALTSFAYAPYIGALAQQAIFQNNMLDTKGDVRKENFEFNSELGKSEGPLSPNEFHHFYRNFIKSYFPAHIPDEELKQVNFENMRKDLASIEHVLNKPFVSKGMMIQYHVDLLYKHIPNSVFYYIKRDPLYVMQSIYKARISYFGNLEKWWSVQPKEYETLISKNVYEQIAGQVYYTDQALGELLALIPDSNKIEIEYEAFCSNSKKTLDRIVSIYKNLGVELKTSGYQTPNFQHSNTLKIEETEFQKLAEAYNKLNSNG